MVRRRLKPWVVITFFIMCLIGIIYSSYRILTWKSHVEENEKIQDVIDEKIVIIRPSTENGELESEELEYNIDFESLKEKNPDTVAYIKVNNTNIDYVVVKGKDNSYYLNHNFDKKWNVAGWIFGDYHNKFDDTDKNLVIYGHSIKSGSMFGTLRKVLNKDWYENEDNHLIVLITESGMHYYEVFSTYSIIAEDYYINTSFQNNNEFDGFIKKLKSRSIYNYGIEVNGEDRILTLSSCIGDGKKRVVLHAKLVD